MWRKTTGQVCVLRMWGLANLNGGRLYAGEIITRTRTKGTELNELYNTMKEALVYFTHLVSLRCGVVLPWTAIMLLLFVIVFLTFEYACFFRTTLGPRS